MRFLLDVCVSSRALRMFLAEQGHDVLLATAIDPRASDERLMDTAFHEQRVLLTEDKDFGELAFVRRLSHGPIIRLVGLTVNQQVEAVGELVERLSDELSGSVIVTITRDRIRVRRQ